MGSEILLSRTIYGESLANPHTTNHRGRVYRTYDGGGQATTPAYDFRGLPTSSELELLLDPTAKNDWTSIANQSTIAAMATAAAPSLESTTYTSSTTHDALGRVLTAISPDGSEVAYAYNERGALKTVDCKHRGAQSSTPVVAEITYDVRGRRESITYASNATTTTYEYDPLNFRLRAIETTRSSDSKKLQGLHYHYDPVGNVTDISDDAQQTAYFQNAIVEAANSYEYDALYRLVKATGREHASQGTAQRDATQLLPDSSAVPMANDPNALRRYTQTFSYDAVGNLTEVVHTPATGTGWTRRYQYRDDGNRLVATSAPGDSAGPLYSNNATYSHTYPHDEHGNFTAMPHMSAMEWDELDQLYHCTVGSQDLYFQYAAGGRVRKYVEHAGSTTEERIYLGAFELYRKRVNGVLKEEWESLHISDDTGRIVLVETHTVDDGNVVGSPTGIWRFQLSNHLGSAATEVTETGAVISYEEYHAYGTSAYRLQNSQIDVPAKRYRYTGMERDDETGLGYHTARYYAPWLGRWTASDPIGLTGGINRFKYATDPVSLSDQSGTNPNPNAEPEDTYARTAVWSDANNQPIEGPEGITVIEFANEPLLTKQERMPSRQSSLPVGTAVASDYHEIVDIPAPNSVDIQPAERPMTAGELCAGGNSPLCQTFRDNSALPQRLEDMKARIHASQMTGMKGMLAYSSALVLTPFAVEAGLVGFGSSMTGVAMSSKVIATTGPGVVVGGMTLAGALATENYGPGQGARASSPLARSIRPKMLQEGAGNTNVWTSPSALDQVTGRTAQVRQQAIDAVLNTDLKNVRMTHHPRYSPYTPSGIASPPGHPLGTGIQIGYKSFSSRSDLINTIVHEELHFRWWSRGIPSPHHSPDKYVPDERFYRTVERFMRLKGLDDG